MTRRKAPEGMSPFTRDPGRAVRESCKGVTVAFHRVMATCTLAAMDERWESAAVLAELACELARALSKLEVERDAEAAAAAARSRLAIAKPRLIDDLAAMTGDEP